MAELVLIAEIDNGKNLDMDEIKQTLEQDLECLGGVGEVREIDAKKLKAFFSQFENVLDLLEQFNNKVDDINRFNEPVDAEKWEYLNHYYIKPLNQEVQEISEKWLDLEV